ncbi:GL24558 [Drosophila persimilis]|uniref:GL24558 n=1 Tax=Drosophila persimilis TaxID=7234 RepID=B4HBR7_DROPE|nr:GL24558 [Drosophila persimilis]
METKRLTHEDRKKKMEDLRAFLEEQQAIVGEGGYRAKASRQRRASVLSRGDEEDWCDGSQFLQLLASPLVSPAPSGHDSVSPTVSSDEGAGESEDDVICIDGPRAPTAQEKAREATADEKLLICPVLDAAPIDPTVEGPPAGSAAANGDLGAELTNRVRQDLHMDINTVSGWFWSDSTVVLSWINASSTYHTFVANRIAKIQALTNQSQWRHVSSANNAADVLSRGIAASRLADHNLWLYGPLFLHGSRDNWTKAPNIEPSNLERKAEHETMSSSELVVDLKKLYFHTTQNTQFCCLTMTQSSK